MQNSGQRIKIIKYNNDTKCSIDLNYVPIELFKELNIIQLIGIIAFKNFNDLNDKKEYFKKLSLTKWPNKGNVDDAINGTFNLIKLAFDSRNKNNQLSLQSFDKLFLDNSSEYNNGSLIVYEVHVDKFDGNKIKKDVEAILFDDNWCDNVWKFLDYNDKQSPDIKCRALSEYNLKFAV